MKRGIVSKVQPTIQIIYWAVSLVSFLMDKAGSRLVDYKKYRMKPMHAGPCIMKINVSMKISISIFRFLVSYKKDNCVQQWSYRFRNALSYNMNKIYAIYPKKISMSLRQRREMGNHSLTKSFDLYTIK